MTDAEERSGKLSEVARLATLIADRILEAQVTNRPISQEQFNALAKQEANGQSMTPRA